MSDEERKAQEQIDATLGLIEGVAAAADVAAGMRDALVHRGFSETISEQTGVQFMFIGIASAAVNR